MNAIIDNRPMPRIASVEVRDHKRIRVAWSTGARAGTTDVVDLSPLIDKFKLYAPLRADRKLFASFKLVDNGSSLEWSDGEIDMAATSIERLAEEQMTFNDFADFLAQNNLTRAEAAVEFGRSLRTIQEYLVESDDPLPRMLVLACRGYEYRKLVARYNHVGAIGSAWTCTPNNKQPYWQTGPVIANYAMKQSD